MKKTLLMASVSLLAASTFCACSNKDGDGDDSSSSSLKQIVISNVVKERENDPDVLKYIDTVKLEFTYKDVDDESKTYTVCSAAYADGKATLNLPATLDDKWLTNRADDLLKIVENFPIDGGGIKVTNRDVKLLSAQLKAYGSGSRYGIGFYHGTAENNGFRSYFMYANGSVSITGKADFSDGDGNEMQLDYNIELKKGWNIVYWWDSATELTMTTQAPADVCWIYSY